MAGVLNLGLAYAAGVLTILSPCVLPLVPVVLGGAAQRHRAGPFALAAGLVVSFTGVGLIVASLGAGADVGGDVVRYLGAALLLAVGLLLVIPSWQAAVTRAAGPLANWAAQRQNGLERFGLAGQAGIGVLLGFVWSPCVGPTLGAATVLAAEGHDLPAVAATMTAFALGIATVLLFVSFATRSLLARSRGSLMRVGGGVKRVLGMSLGLVGLLIITGLDHRLEAGLLNASPDWLVQASTSI